MIFAGFDGGPVAPFPGAVTLQLPPCVQTAGLGQHQVFVAVEEKNDHVVSLWHLDPSEGGGEGGGGGEAVKGQGGVSDIRIIVTETPVRGQINAPPGYTLAPSASHMCGGSRIAGFLLHAVPAPSSSKPPVAILYHTATGVQGAEKKKGAGDAFYDSFAYLICAGDSELGAQVMGQRIVTINLLCSNKGFAQTIGRASQCVPCPAGSVADYDIFRASSRQEILSVPQS